ncbi:MAG: FliA/WhiG family RNA polymerase sigma factor [Defluviitaleaceae bacterium]|nr:FliA/WhiG family RNA polymerase sigma factor [Defluviitaleaceae bacterium]
MNTKENAESIKKAWDAFAKNNDHAVRQSAKETLILHYSPMIKFVVGRLNIYVGSAIDQEDLISYGVFGLIDAIEKFNHEKGVKFETYASLRIRGAVLDGIRALDWVPRTMRQKSRQLDEAYTALESELGREPKEHEIAQKLEINKDQVADEIKKSSLMSLISLDDYLDQNHEKDFSKSLATDENAPEAVFANEELKQELAEAISALTEKEQMVVALYYYEELTLKEISKVLEVTESRVSQIHSKAMLKLRTKLGKHKALLLT